MKTVLIVDVETTGTDPGERPGNRAGYGALER